jgi:type I restriction enzyme S subunit
MTLETFFAKFELFADAPNAVAKMRELVVQLAVQGGLVPHSATESAVPYASVEDATPINISDVPANWRVVLLGDAAKNRSGNSKLIKGKLFDAPAPNLFQGFSASGADVWCEDYENEGEAIIISAVGARCGKAFKASGKWSAIANTNIVRPESTLFNFDFAYLVMNDEHFWVRGGSAQPFVKFPPSLNRHFALPPLAEQKRIVAKVDELMALCDRLEAQQQERETQHVALARASLARFADAPTPENLNLLFHKSFDVAPSALRKSILTLAVQGKLVCQDPNDESVTILINDLNQLKLRLLTERKIRNQKVSDTPDHGDFPFDIPVEWRWVRLGEVVTLLGGYAYASGAYISASLNQIIRLGNVKNDNLLLDQRPAFISDALAQQTDEYAILEGDILVTMTGTKGKRDYAFTLAVSPADLANRRLFLNQRVGAIRPFRRELVPLINLFLKSDQLLDLVFATSTGTANQANIGTSSILDLPFPLPPLAEQRRIAAKVDQLMALVDQLETQLATSRATAANLLEATVAELTTQ